jgi:hypothetical protein
MEREREREGETEGGRERERDREGRGGRGREWERVGEGGREGRRERVGEGGRGRERENHSQPLFATFLAAVLIHPWRNALKRTHRTFPHSWKPIRPVARSLA